MDSKVSSKKLFLLQNIISLANNFHVQSAQGHFALDTPEKLRNDIIKASRNPNACSRGDYSKNLTLSAQPLAVAESKRKSTARRPSFTKQQTFLRTNKLTSPTLRFRGGPDEAEDLRQYTKIVTAAARRPNASEEPLIDEPEPEPIRLTPGEVRARAMYKDHIKKASMRPSGSEYVPATYSRLHYYGGPPYGIARSTILPGREYSLPLNKKVESISTHGNAAGTTNTMPLNETAATEAPATEAAVTEIAMPTYFAIPSSEEGAVTPIYTSASTDTKDDIIETCEACDDSEIEVREVLPTDKTAIYQPVATVYEPVETITEQPYLIRSDEQPTLISPLQSSERSLPIYPELVSPRLLTKCVKYVKSSTKLPELLSPRLVSEVAEDILKSPREQTGDDDQTTPEGVTTLY